MKRDKFEVRKIKNKRSKFERTTVRIGKFDRLGAGDGVFEFQDGDVEVEPLVLVHRVENGPLHQMVSRAGEESLACSDGRLSYVFLAEDHVSLVLPCVESEEIFR